MSFLTHAVLQLGGQTCFSMMLMIGSSSEWIYSHSGAGDLATWIRENRYMQAYVHVSFQVFHFSPLNLNFYRKFFFPLTKMFPSFKLFVDSLSCYSCGQKPSFLSLSEIHLEIDNLTSINWICWTKVSLFLSTFGFLRVKVTMEFHIVHLHLVPSHCFTKCYMQIEPAWKLHNSYLREIQ